MGNFAILSQFYSDSDSGIRKSPVFIGTGFAHLPPGELPLRFHKTESAVCVISFGFVIISFMPNIKVLPHAELCPEGKVLQCDSGETVCDVLLSHDIAIEHACEKSCACTTCHVIVRDGYRSLDEATEDEEDMLDKAWGLEPESRLSCQAVMKDADIVVEIPKYTVNHARENH